MAKDDGFVEVQETLDPEEALAQTKEFVESLPERGEGMFRKTRKANRAPQKIEASEPDEGEQALEEEPTAPEPATRQAAPEKPKPEAPEAAGEQPKPEELISDNLARAIEQALLGPEPTMDPARSAAFKRQESRELLAAKEEARKSQETLQAVIAELRGSRQAQPAKQEPEEEVDLFAEPDKYIEKKIGPLLSRLEQQQQTIARLEQAAQAGVIRQAEDAFRRSTPGYEERVKTFNQAAYQDYVEFFGGDEQAATEMMNQTYSGWLMLAQRAGRQPFEVVHEMAGRYLRSRGLPVPGDNGARQPQTPPAAPAAPAQPASKIRRDSSIAAAQAAIQSPSGQSLSSGGAESDAVGDLSAATLIEMGPRAASQAVRQLMAARGVDALASLIEPIEEAAMRERGR